MKTGHIKSKMFRGAPYRIDPSFHLSEGIKVRRMLDNVPYGLTTVEDASDKVFIGNIFSRVFVKDAAHGVPYLAASDTVLSNLNTGRYLSKKQAAELSYLILKKDWILATCSGTLGNVTYTNKEFDGRIATHDLIRIVPNDKNVLRGCLYAFLASKYGYFQLTESMFGGVVKHINAEHAKSITIPLFPKEIQQKADSLIKESARLREEAANELRTAHKIIETVLHIPINEKKNNVSVHNIISSHTHRLEGEYYVSSNREIYEHLIQTQNHKTLKDYTDKIFRPGIFKREYVRNGVPFLGGSDIMLATPKSDKQLSYRQVGMMPELKVAEGWILITCGGTIGNSVYVDKQLSECTVSQHVIRIVPKKDAKTGFLYAFLSSDIGFKLITLYSYGSVIPQVEPHHLERIPIPHIATDAVNQIDNLVKNYASKNSAAKEKEIEAISLVEAEIEKWNN